MIKAYNLVMLLIGLSLFGLSGILVAQQKAVAPGGMAPVAQHLTDLNISYSYIAHDNGVVLVSIFTKDRNWKAAPTCELLTEIGPVTKVTIWYEIEEPTTETVITEEAGNITISAVSVDSAVCTE